MSVKSSLSAATAGVLKYCRKYLGKIKKIIIISDFSAEKAALNIATGLGTIFIPFPMLQTPFVIFICFALRLHFPLVYLINWIHNQFTALPIVLGSVIVGQYAIEMSPFQYPMVDTLSLDLSTMDLNSLKNFFAQFVVGSTILMLAVPALFYPLVYFAVKKFMSKNNG